jgi:hypothetical protein
MTNVLKLQLMMMMSDVVEQIQDDSSEHII